MTLSKKVVIFLLTVMSCLILIGGETNYTAAEKKFVRNFWETQSNAMKEMHLSSASKEAKMKAFKKILLAGDIAILSSDCPKDFKQHWQFYSANAIPMLNIITEVFTVNRPFTEKEREYIIKVDKASTEMQRIYNKCK